MLATERQLLRRICANELDFPELRQLIDRLSEYSWRDPEHATVFQAIRRLASRARASSQWLREIPAEATRMGFPDVDWPRYFSGNEPDEPSIPVLLARLRGAGQHQI